MPECDSNEPGNLPVEPTNPCTDDWLRAIYAQLHGGIQSNERLLTQFGTLALGFVSALLSFVVANYDAFAELNKGQKILFFVIIAIVSIFSIVELDNFAIRIRDGFKRLVKLEECVGFYEKRCLVPGDWFDSKYRLAGERRPRTFWTFFYLFLAIVMLSIMATGYFVAENSSASISQPGEDQGNRAITNYIEFKGAKNFSKTISPTANPSKPKPTAGAFDVSKYCSTLGASVVFLHDAQQDVTIEIDCDRANVILPKNAEVIAH